MSKAQLGQFMTTNSAYILQNFDLPKNISTIIEPFTGNADLITFVKHKRTNTFFECYDIDPKTETTIKRDTILDPPDYNNKYIITNPPYLARNKSQDKKAFDKYKMNDLYKCFIKEISGKNHCDGGIIIVPLNFWCSIRKMDVDLRCLFLKTYRVCHVNVFDDQVFDDTGYGVCSFQFELRNNENDDSCIPFIFFPENKKLLIKLENYTIGEELYNLNNNNTYKISRLISGNTPNTNILVKCIDDKGKQNISMSIVDDKDIFYDNTPNKSARTFATLIITPVISKEMQKTLVKSFNEFLMEKREKYNSLFMSNYREGGRKRISFELVYDIVGHLLN